MSATAIPRTNARSSAARRRPTPRTLAGGSLEQVVTYTRMLQAALGDDPVFYRQLARRGFLDCAIEHAQYALDEVVHAHGAESDVARLIERAVLDPLRSARALGTTPPLDVRDLASELRMAGAAAANAVAGLQSLAAAR